MKTTPRRMFALLLALVLLLSLCACTQKTQTEPDEPKINTAHKKTPESQQEEAVLQSNGNDFVSQDKTVDTPPVQYAFSQEAETSLGWLRDRIDFPKTMFGAAYLGYVGGLFDEGFEAGFLRGWWKPMKLSFPPATLYRRDQRCAHHRRRGASVLHCAGRRERDGCNQPCAVERKNTDR